jgi:ectoine hydroxylase-related dioxygenase (phytanoyl-CoA dioxygenase family)
MSALGAVGAARRISDAIATLGWVVTDPIVASGDVDALTASITSHQGSAAARGGMRNLFDVPSVRKLAQSPNVRAVAEAVLGPSCVAVKATLFDKTPNANWKVAWHQDVTIAVEGRTTAAGYGPWSEKEGVTHVQPPAAILEQMLAVRIHLDDCGAENGPVRVLSSTHLAGKMSGAVIDAFVGRADPVECLVDRGGVLAFRPLLLHASSPSRSPAHRRVVHLEFAAAQLQNGFAWATEVGSSSPGAGR